MAILYRIFWKHEDFYNHSEGPILKHSKKGTTKNGRPYTKKEASRICTKFNLRSKDNKVRHWVKEVLA